MKQIIPQSPIDLNRQIQQIIAQSEHIFQYFTYQDETTAQLWPLWRNIIKSHY